LQLDDFERVRRGGKHLRQQRIRIERAIGATSESSWSFGIFAADDVVVVAACGCGNREATIFVWMRSAVHSTAVARLVEVHDRPSSAAPRDGDF